MRFRAFWMSEAEIRDGEEWKLTSPLTAMAAVIVAAAAVPARATPMRAGRRGS
jgi:hypothetical protein